MQSSAAIQLAIAGAAGRMGRALIAAAARAADLHIAAAIEHPEHPAVGKDAGVVAGEPPLGVAVRADLAGDFDVLIAFATPAATLEHLTQCRRQRRAIVIGTTGFDAAERARIREAGAEIPLLLAANTSIGMNMCVTLAATAAAMLKESAALNAFDIEIVEAHHRHKVDAPSGTALLLGETMAAATGKNLDAAGVFARHGKTAARNPGDIGFSAIRGGDLAGEHTVLFIGDGERVEITHRATDRKIFAAGALRAAAWLARQPPGCYSMRDVLGLAPEGSANA